MNDVEALNEAEEKQWELQFGHVTLNEIIEFRDMDFDGIYAFLKEHDNQEYFHGSCHFCNLWYLLSTTVEDAFYQLEDIEYKMKTMIAEREEKMNNG